MDTVPAAEHKKHHKIPWLAVFLGLCAIASFVASKSLSPTLQVTSTSPAIPQGIQINTAGDSDRYIQPESLRGISSAAKSAGQAAYAPTYPGDVYYGGLPDITDTREFNKVRYGAQMRSRDVQGLTKRVETTIRGYDGRVDTTSSSPKYGYVSFIVPASKFDSFRDELESLVNTRYLSVNIQSQNLLPQKQGIEKNQADSQESLDDLNSRKEQITASHKSTIKSLQAQLDSDTTQINKLQSQAFEDSIADSQRLAAIEALAQSQAALRTRIASENSSYNSSLNSINDQISWAQSSLDSANTRDTDLMNDVATVNGTVSINWISIWEIVHLYLPGMSIPGILAALSVLAYAWHYMRERHQSVVRT